MLAEKVHVECVRKTCCGRIKQKLEDIHCSFHPGAMKFHASTVVQHILGICPRSLSMFSNLKPYE